MTLRASAQEKAGRLSSRGSGELQGAGGRRDALQEKLTARLPILDSGLCPSPHDIFLPFLPLVFPLFLLFFFIFCSPSPWLYAYLSPSISPTAPLSPFPHPPPMPSCFPSFSFTNNCSNSMLCVFASIVTDLGKFSVSGIHRVDLQRVVVGITYNYLPRCLHLTKAYVLLAPKTNG